MGLRMVATDLDGTVVRRDQTISPRTLAAFAACERAGVDVAFVTGRPPRWVTPLAEATGRRGLAVCGNGAVVLDLATGAVVEARTLPPALVLDVATRLRRRLPGLAVAVETLGGFRREPGYQPRYDIGAEHEVAELAALLDDDPGVVKVLLRQEGGTADAMLAVARAELDGVAEPVHSNAADCLLEVAAPGVTKASAVAALAAARGIDAADVVAFGDMPNDLAMLAWAGRGYAMADGHPEALAAASGTAPPCEEDGVAQVLEALLAEEGALARDALTRAGSRQDEFMQDEFMQDGAGTGAAAPPGAAPSRRPRRSSAR